MSDKTLEIEFEHSCMVLGMSQADFDMIGDASNEFLQRLFRSLPADTSAAKRIDLSSSETAPSWAYVAYEAMWAAAYQGQKAYAEGIYSGCGLNSAHWSFSGIGAACPQPCPICFEMTEANWNAGCGHGVYQAMDEISDELPCSTRLQSLDEALQDLDLDNVKEIQLIPEVDRVLKNLFNHKPWFLGFECSREIRDFSVLNDIDQSGGIEYFGFHPNPKMFLAGLSDLEKGIVSLLSEMGIDDF